MKEADFVDWMHDENGPRTSAGGRRSGAAYVPSRGRIEPWFVRWVRSTTHRIGGRSKTVLPVEGVAYGGGLTLGRASETGLPNGIDAVFGMLLVGLGLTWLPRRAAVFGLVGIGLGAFVGGAGFWWIGYTAIAAPSGSLVGAVAFVVSFIAFVGGAVSPLTMGLALRSGLEGRARRELVTLGAYGLLVLCLAGLALFGSSLLVGIGIDTAIEAIAFSNAVFGATIGGIVGGKAGARFVQSSLKA